MHQDNRPILLIEDDPEAADLLRLALKKAPPRIPSPACSSSI